ncbi:hypothetical protein KCU65_g435, partial [Aureobasidium melanogenum]
MKERPTQISRKLAPDINIAKSRRNGDMLKIASSASKNFSATTHLTRTPTMEFAGLRLANLLIALLLTMSNQHWTEAQQKAIFWLLLIDFPQVKNFRFAIFFARSLVEEKREIPEALKYLFGTLKYMKRTATLKGATTEMEKKFVRKQLYERRRARFDHVQIHEDSLRQGYLIPKVDEDDVNGVPMGGQFIGGSTDCDGYKTG